MKVVFNAMGRIIEILFFALGGKKRQHQSEKEWAFYQGVSRVALVTIWSHSNDIPFDRMVGMRAVHLYISCDTTTTQKMGM